DTALAALVSTAMSAYAEHPAIVASLNDLQHRMGEPLRIAVLGKVKAGKSTLVNALIGRKLAPTSLGPNTDFETWYRYGEAPRVVVHPDEGDAFDVGFSLRPDGLHLVPGDLPVTDANRIVIDWPAPFLQGITLIDMPGIDSPYDAAGARAAAQFDEVDAVI